MVLEGTSHVWNRMLAGLSVGQLSFLLRAGADCLPTPMNLCRWNCRVSNSCPLCQSPNANTAHILNGWPKARPFLKETQLCSKWFDFSDSLKIDRSTKMFADLPGKQASASPLATIPADMSTATSRPDLLSVVKAWVRLLERH